MWEVCEQDGRTAQINLHPSRQMSVGYGSLGSVMWSQ